MAILLPADYYARCAGELRYMRTINGPFEDGLAKGQRKRLRKCLDGGFRVEPATVSVCYPIIEDNRLRKGRRYRVSKADWLELSQTPNTVYTFCVMPGILAAALCVRVAPETLYVSAWGDAEGQETLSPVVLLAKGIYDFCAANGFKTLDAGIAGEPSLIAFKQRLGFQPRIL